MPGPAPKNPKTTVRPAKKSTAKKRPAAKTTARKKAPRKSKPVDPKLSRAVAREALDDATRAIGRLQKDAGRNSWAIGRRLMQVSELRLYQAGGHPTMEAYVEEKLKITRQTSYQYMRVAEAFSEEVVAAFGIEKLDRALRYVAATPDDEKPSDIPELRIAVPGEDGAPAKTKPFAELTVSELRRATQAVAAGEKKGARLPEGLAGTLSKANRALDKTVGTKAARAAEIRARPTEGGVLLDVRGLPLERAAAALRALAAALR
jgi:hypothetical protein